MKKKKLIKKSKAKSGINDLFQFRWILFSLLGTAVLVLYFIFLSSNINSKAECNYHYVEKPISISALADSLQSEGILSSRWTLGIVAQIFKFNKVNPGLYKIEKGWSNFSLVNHLKTDSIRPSQEINIIPVQQRKNLVKQICKEVGLKEIDINAVLKDSVYLKSLDDFNKESIYSIFIPQKYRMYKNIQAKEFVEIVYFNFCKFWNEDRLEKAEDLGYSPAQIGVLASIVYAETKNLEEMPMIAGLYLNRLNKNMRLESDPTLVYATGNFASQRVLRKYAEINSPYNTYRKKGLPPGPIFIAPAKAIDAVLNYIPHDYIFFCAKDDFSGCHIFSESYEKHKENAGRYRKELDKRKIN